MIYEDKLDGEITPDEYREKRSKYLNEQQKTKEQIEKYEGKNINYFENANMILELAKKASYAYKNQKTCRHPFLFLHSFGDILRQFPTHNDYL